MAEVSGLDMVREIIGQINNLRKLVTIGGKQYKWDAANKKYKSVKDGKVFTRPQLIDYVKNQKFTAPKVPKPKTKLQVKTTPKATTTKTNPLKIGMNKLNQFTQNQQYNRGQNTINPKRTDGKLRFGTDSGAMTKDGMTRGSRATVNNMMQQRGKGAGVVLPLLSALTGEQGLDVGGRIANMLTNAVTGDPDFNLQERKAFNAQQMANRELKIQQNKATKEAQRKSKNVYLSTPNPELTDSIGRSRQDPYLNRSAPTPTPKKEETKEQVKVNKKKNKSTVGKVMGDYAGSYNETKTKKKDKKKEGKPKEQIAWEKKSKNSPARKSGAFTDKELWNQYKKHQEWLKKNNRLKVRS